MIDYTKAATALTQLADATAAKRRSDAQWQKAIINARDSGLSYSAIAQTADKSESYCRKVYESWVASPVK